MQENKAGVQTYFVSRVTVSRGGGNSGMEENKYDTQLTCLIWYDNVRYHTGGLPQNFGTCGRAYDAMDVKIRN